MKLRFILDHTESPFWTCDPETKAEFGSNVNLQNLGLGENSKIRLKTVLKLFHQRLNPVNRRFPSLWSGRMNVFFQTFLKQIYKEIELELKDRCELENGEFELMNEEIDIEQIDRDLEVFLNDPSKFADRMGITYKSKRELKEKVRSAYKDWEKSEFKWTAM